MPLARGKKAGKAGTAGKAGRAGKVGKAGKGGPAAKARKAGKTGKGANAGRVAAGAPRAGKSRKYGAHGDYAVLHIPKTGGTSLSAVIDKMRNQGHQYPGLFGHAARFDKIVAKHPDIKVCLVIRDPIERIASGFMSRLRMGRPTFQNNLWTVGEAAVFAFFPDPVSLLKGLVSDDERLKSAALFAFKHVNHLKRNYVHYFGSVEQIERNLGNFGVIGELGRFGDFVNGLVARVDPSITDIAAIYEHKHASPTKTGVPLESFSADERERLMAFLAEDYAIYNRLARMINT